MAGKGLEPVLGQGVSTVLLKGVRVQEPPASGVPSGLSPGRSRSCPEALFPLVGSPEHSWPLEAQSTAGFGAVGSCCCLSKMLLLLGLVGRLPWLSALGSQAAREESPWGGGFSPGCVQGFI